jgi:OmpA-OmpF porin, OOP family
MFSRISWFLISLFFIGAAQAAPSDYTATLSADATGSADSAFMGRYEGSTIVGQTSKVFDELVLPSGPTDARGKVFSQVVSQKGKVLRTLYVSPEARSSLEVFGNYTDAIKAKGFVPVFECAAETCGPKFKELKYRPNEASSIVISDNVDTRRLNVSRGMFNKIVDPRYMLFKKGEAGGETYIAIFAAQNAGGSMGDISKALRSRVGVLIEVVEPGIREDKIITLSANEIDSAIGTAGRVVFYGIYFDFNEAKIKPESLPQLNELVAFLQAANGKRYFVVGHTDNKGEVDYNVKLASARADAVVAALVKAGISSNMLLAKGVGPFAPIASNATEEGQAKNRRVELVEK